MDEETKTPTVDADRAIADIREQELTRVRSITAMGQQHNMPGLANQLIEGGKSVEESRTIFDTETSARNNQQPLSRTSPQDYLPGFGQKENSQYSLLRAYRSRIPGTPEYTGNCFEKEISNEIAQKTGQADGGIHIPYRHLSLLGTRDRDIINTSTQASGGVMVQDTVLGTQFIDLLRNKSSVLSAGATFLPGLVGSYTMPGQATGVATYWISENEDTPEGSITFRGVTLAQKTIAARVPITRNMIMQSSVEVENIARRDLAAQIALGLDKAALYGAGGKEPLGILNTPGIGGTSLGNDGGALTWAALVNLWKAIKVGNGDTGTMGWIMPAAVAAKLMTTPMQASGVEGNFILKADSDRLILFPYQVTEQMPDDLTKGNGTNLGTILLGVWSEFVIGNWGTLSIDINPYGQAWGTGGLEMRAMQSADCAVRNPVSFAAYSDVITV